MALRYSYDTGQGGWVLDNKGHFQTPYRIGQYYGQNVQGFRAYQDFDGLDTVTPTTEALVLGYSRDNKNQCYIDPEASRNPYVSDGCPSPRTLPVRSALPVRTVRSAKPTISRDMIALIVIIILVVLALGAVSLVRHDFEL